jgi:thiol-disulfide isomerase/thioredoxin
MRTLLIVALAALVVAACGASDVDASAIPELPTTTPEEVRTLLDTSAEPVVLNVWASWCIPCRSEAPLLDRAADEFEGAVRFVGVNVRDTQEGAREFIAEFFPEAAIEHLFDPGGAVPPALGGSNAVPLTFFYASGGDLVELHTGVLDERTLALQIDEIIARSG